MKKTPLIRNFVVFEGGDGSGTSTQLDFLRCRVSGSLRRGGTLSFPGALPFLHTSFEPTDGPVGRLIRSALKGEIPLGPETLARLFAADRGEHLYAPEGILARAERGELVVCDRYVPSSLVYQSIECGEDLPLELNRAFPVPELLLFFDLDPQTAAGRIKDRKEKEIYEYLAFQIQVRERYRLLLPRFADAGVRVETIDSSKSVDDVAEDVWSAIEKMPILKGAQN
jgi:dTMP kinase